MQKKKQFAVLGLGRFGVSAAMTLEKMGYEVLAADMDTNLVSSLAENLSQVVSFDMRDARAMDQAGIGSFDTVIIATKNLEASLMAAMLCKERHVPEIVVNAFDDRHAEMARRLGATKIIFSDRDMARRTVMHLVSPNAVDYIDLAGSIKIVNVTTPPRLVGKNLVEADLRRHYNLVVVAIRHAGQMIVTPSPDYRFAAGDNLFIIGKESSFVEFERDF
ncbi:putative potassium uptake protein [Selenomonas ruminantium subsp. lactilytica TAM6421]|uniref:Putative potassium uptake protein n=1 Tax=Selenomonas ruminantium subsp. lactilytica (strain NBRC 103574 / TAM6421) TaxID=927704 RepID=I0GST1_SELRL|nr:TrkA family potassium uptake protein [Selenomonas ruminantium]BAL83818.1 putative potassium uptake protein [Selenomonas ruminantium subsp. lactilytica TAM6421]